MSKLVRKIDQGKWLQFDIINNADVSADAITNCMRTQNNQLSVWEIESENHIDEAALAIVAGQQRLEAIDVIAISTELITKIGIQLDDHGGLTKVQDLVKTHHNLIELSYTKLGLIAKAIVEQFQLDQVKRYTATDQKELLQNAIKAGRLHIDDLPDSIRKKIE